MKVFTTSREIIEADQKMDEKHLMPNVDDKILQQMKRWEFYRDNSNQWQWRKFEHNKVVAVSADGFSSRQACANDARRKGYIGS